MDWQSQIGSFFTLATFETSSIICCLKKEIKKAESNQIGVMRRGGNWQEILEYLNTDYLLLEKNRLDDWEYKKHDIKYKVISGNY